MKSAKRSPASSEPDKDAQSKTAASAAATAAKWTAIGVIATALFGFLSALAAQYFGYLQITTPVELHATQTAEAHIAATVQAIGTPSATITPTVNGVSTSSIPPVSLVGLNYTVDEWNTRSLDLQLASGSGIGVDPTGTLRFSDVQVSVPSTMPGYQVYAEFYGSDDLTQPIGTTDPVPLTTGVTNLGDVKIETHESKAHIWSVQPEWRSVIIWLLTMHENEVVSRNRYEVKLDSRGTAWFQSPPNVATASLVYAINDGPDQILDFRDSETHGIEANQPFTLTLREVWYSSNDQRDTRNFNFHAGLQHGAYDGSTERHTDTINVQTGIHKVEPFGSWSWAIPADFVNNKYTLVTYWIRNDGAVMGSVAIPITFNPKSEMALESITSGLHSYLTSEANPKSISILSGIYQTGSSTEYEHTYSFADTKGLAGLIFELAKPEDLSSYDAVEFTIEFKGSLGKCFLGMRDSTSGNHAEAPCKEPFTPESGIKATVDAGQQTLTIPLHNYSAIALTAIDQVYTDIEPAVPGDAGTVKISNIRFIKQ